ncbi:MAG TPA: DUF2399 domain-containing protein [Solirubrobacterales bacterium]|nr:DUF2399 domain-containing protein [Solirubrobacterales bacterium]
MSLGASTEKLLLAGVPDGLVARPLREYRRSDDGEPVEVRTRRRQRKIDRVELVPEAAAAPLSALELTDSERQWLLGAGQRRWSSITGRYGEQAWPRATQLAQAGVVRLRCAVDERMALGEPQGWVLTEDWEELRADESRQRALNREQTSERAAAAALAIAERCPELAAALRTAPPGSSITPVLVFAAEDLLDGVTHAGPRAFSQAHFGSTKARDNVTQTLLDAGVPNDVLVDLGVRRSARLGVAGPVRATVGKETTALDLLDGPVLLRADQKRLTLTLTSPAPLVIVENLQAAEVLADRMSDDTALLYTAGLPSRPALHHIASLAAQAPSAIVVPDADLGGVRIGEAILKVAPGAQLLDVGELDHPPRAKWPEDGVSARGLRAALAGPAGALAQACLDRGYPVEQEIATVEAVRNALGSDKAQ